MFSYLKLMLLNRVAGLRPSNLRKEGKSRAKATASYIGYAALFVLLYASIVMFEVFLFWLSSNMGQPDMLLAVTFLICTLLALIYGFFNVVSILFFNRDNAFIAALPITSRSVMLAKLLTVLAGEFGLTLGVGLPLVVMYGITQTMNALYYIRALIMMLFVPMIPIAVAALLAFALIRVSSLWKRRESLTIIFSFLLMAGIIFFQVNMSMNAVDDGFATMLSTMLFGQTSITNMLLNAYPPLKWMCGALTESGWAAWKYGLMFAGLSIASLALVAVVTGGGYLNLALKQEETLRRVNAGKRAVGKDVKRSPFRALYRREMLDVITVPVYATNCLSGIVMYPVIIIVMYLSMQQQFIDGMPLMQTLLSKLPRTLYLVIASGGLCFTSTMGLAIATAISREGKHHEFRCMIPVSGRTQLLAKLGMGISYNVFAALFTAVVLWVLLPGFWLETLIAFIVSQLFSVLWCIVSLLMEVYHARLKWKTETEAVKQNMNSFFCMLIGIVILAALVGVFYLCIRFLSLSMTMSLMICVALIVLANVVLYRRLVGKAARDYVTRDYLN